MKSLQFYVKLMLKNPIFYVVILLNLYFFYFLYFALRTSSIEFVTYTYYLNIIMNLATLFLGYYYAMNKKWIHLFYERDLWEKGSRLMFSLLLIVCIYIFMNAIYMILFGEDFVIKGLFYLIILFSVSTLLASTIGVISGVLFNRLWAIIFPLAFYSLFIFSSLTYRPPFVTFFNLYADNLRLERNSLIGIQFNAIFWLDKLFIIVICLIFLCVATTILTKIRKWKLLSLGAIICCILVNVFIMNKSEAIQQQHFYEVEAVENHGFLIKNYKMNINLQQQVENKVSIDLKAEKAMQYIKLNLNKSFTVHKVQLNKSKKPFTFKEGILVIDTPLEKNKEVTLEISYSGKVYFENMNYPIVYSTANSTSLPGFRFAWYPQNKQKMPIHFDVIVKGNKRVYSTLASASNHHFNSVASTVSLFSSPLYKNEKYKGKTYYVPKFYQVKLAVPNFKEEKSLIKDSQLSPNKKHRIIVGDYKEILVIPKGLINDSFTLIDDTLLLSVIE